MIMTKRAFIKNIENSNVTNGLDFRHHMMVEAKSRVTRSQVIPLNVYADLMELHCKGHNNTEIGRMLRADGYQIGKHYIGKLIAETCSFHPHDQVGGNVRPYYYPTPSDPGHHHASYHSNEECCDNEDVEECNCWRCIGARHAFILSQMVAIYKETGQFDAVAMDLLGRSRFYDEESTLQSMNAVFVALEFAPHLSPREIYDMTIESGTKAVLNG